MSVELLAPAGDFDTALAAFDAGADAVYCGLGSFSARAFAKNFTPDRLRELVRVARRDGKKIYVTFNTLVDEGDMERAVRELAELDRIGPDALVVQDLGVARICRRYFPSLELHASTQLAAHNLAGVNALRSLGFRRVVPARELSAAEVEFLVKRSGGMEFECFIHGALCYSISGLCLFSAMEEGRSGNRGECAYCCRLPQSAPNGKKVFPFSMKDLRLGEDVGKLVAAGVSSLKIEGRMKSALYVASVVRWYRQMLDGRGDGPRVTPGDLETVFSRRTTELYLNGRTDTSDSPVDTESLGHLGAAIGTVKRVTRDREGRAWLRFHTARALERHDGIQVPSPDGGKPLGFGITYMRNAISRVPVFEVSAGTDVELLLPEPQGDGPDLAATIRDGAKVYCSMSNAVKRMFPVPGYRSGDYPGCTRMDVEVRLAKDSIAATAMPGGIECRLPCDLEPAQHPERTADAVRKAFSKLGDTDYALGTLKVEDPCGLFAPPRLLNDLRRDLVERLDAVREAEEGRRLSAALGDDAAPLTAAGSDDASGPRRTIRLRPEQKLPDGDWDEVVYAVDGGTDFSFLDNADAGRVRLALPVFTQESDFSKLRVAVKRLVRAGYGSWEAADLSTLSLLKECGVADITADWTLYAMNASALRQLSELGVRRFVASPENGRGNISFLAESGYDVEFLVQQSVPLFISLTRPGAEPSAESGLVVHRQSGLWITTRALPRTFDPPKGVATRVDLSWSRT